MAAPGPQAEPPPPPAEEEPPSDASILSLPVEVELQIFGQLSAADLAACAATCRAWRASASAPSLWAAVCQRRWPHGWPGAGEDGGAEGLPALDALHAGGQWREMYGLRRQLDARLLAALLGDMPWPDRQQAAMEAASQLASFPLLRDALRQLVTASEAARRTEQPGGPPLPGDWPAAAEWPDVAAAVAQAPCSAAYWARRVFEELSVRHSARQLSAAARQVDAALAALQQNAAAPAGPPAAGGDDDEAAPAPAAQGAQAHLLIARWFEAGALALARLHRPFADLGWVERALDALGAELAHRMEAAGVRGGRPALLLLSQLLFGEGPPARHPLFSSIPPPDPYGLEITGNRERYYEAANSMLDHVLGEREGIPISLAVLHAAVGARAGLPIQLLNVPMHVVTAMDDPEQASSSGPRGARRWYVDVFDRGRIMDSAEFSDFLGGLGLPGGLHREVQAMTPQQCWQRMCRNLLHIYREQQEFRALKGVALLMAAAAGQGSAEGVRAAVEAANACLALQQFGEAVELLRQVTSGPYQLQVGAGPALHAPALAAMLAEIEAAAEAHVQAQMEVHHRDSPTAAAVQFRVGQVLRHKRYAYRGVIVGWDTTCQASPEWIASMGVDRLPGGRRQPFYHVLPDPEDRPGQLQTYVAQENIELEPLPALHCCKPGFALHPEAGRYFTALEQGGGRYTLTAWARRCYPDD